MTELSRLGRCFTLLVFAKWIGRKLYSLIYKGLLVKNVVAIKPNMIPEQSFLILLLQFDNVL